MVGRIEYRDFGRNVKSIVAANFAEVFLRGFLGFFLFLFAGQVSYVNIVNYNTRIIGLVRVLVTRRVRHFFLLPFSFNYNQ